VVNGISETLMLIGETLIYPGAVFSFVVAIFTQWFRRKAYARMQNRMGPTYTGLAGTLQPFADYVKLFFKEDIVVIRGYAKLPAFLLALAIGALMAILLMLPISPYSVYAPYDIIVAAYLLIWPTLTLAALGFLTPSPYGALGSSRLLTLTIAYEVAFLISILTPVVLASRILGAQYSLYLSSIYSWLLWTNPVLVPLMVISLLTALISLQCKLLEKPFDIPEAEQEIVAGPFTEYSGPKLAFIIFIHDIEQYVNSLIIVFLFLGGVAPFVEGPLWAQILIVAIKYIIVVLVLTWIKAMVARFRVDQAIKMLWKYIVPLSLFALIVSTVI